MRSKLMLSFAASAAVVLFQPTSQTVWAQGQEALTGKAREPSPVS